MIRTWKVGIAALALGASPVLAETSGWSYDNNVSGVAYASDGGATSCCDDNCCGGDACCGDSCGCGDGCGSPSCLGGTLLGGAAEAFSLAALIGADGTGLDIGGWTETVYMDNNVPLSQAYNDLRSFDDVPDHAHIGQQWF